MKEIDEARGKRRGIRILLFLFVFMLAGMTPAGPALNPQAAEKAGGGVDEAEKHRISGGKWVKNKYGLRYKKKNGKYLKNFWCTISGKMYYFDSRGYVKTGSFTYGSRRYYASQRGQLYVNKLVKIGGKTYCYGSEGHRIWREWKTLNGKTYYFDSKGVMVKNSWVGNRYVGKDGALVKNRVVQGRRVGSNGVIEDLSNKDKFIIVGASRIEDMSVAVDANKTIFIARSGKGYSWLKNTAYPQLRLYLEQNEKCKVVFNLGNNDLKNINLYIRFYKNLIKKYPDAKFYFLDALPGAKSQTSKNAKRRAFNKKMKAAFGSKCIGGYEYLMQTGYSTVDKIHYTNATSKKIYRYILSKITYK